MNSSGWRIAVVTCLRDKQFWRETVAEAVHLVSSPSNGLGIALAAVMLKIGRRVFERSTL